MLSSCSFYMRLRILCKCWVQQACQNVDNADAFVHVISLHVHRCIMFMHANAQYWFIRYVLTLHNSVCESTSFYSWRNNGTHSTALFLLLSGLQYAEEIGVENDPCPSYRCTLCSISMDGGNQALHFTSTAHRMNVLVRQSFYVRAFL